MEIKNSTKNSLFAILKRMETHARKKVKGENALSLIEANYVKLVKKAIVREDTKSKK